MLVCRNYILVKDYVFVFLRTIMYDVFHRSPCHANNELNSLFSSFTSQINYLDSNKPALEMLKYNNGIINII